MTVRIFNMGTFLPQSPRSNKQSSPHPPKDIVIAALTGRAPRIFTIRAPRLAAAAMAAEKDAE
ncbi:MAG: hypothetical protein A2516_00625 [Alphaproteobacteria bacterium RIFOXYD12_FULL_60_8]|nr:MAG: hypothetical protein A2516_00625 [Alphaproteobacteria bacterium RIFOXYD12_FULL_60_8]